MRGLDQNNKKTVSAILELLILSEKIAKVGKIRISEFNYALNYSLVKKFHMNRLVLNNKKLYLTILKGFEFNRENNLISENLDF